MAASSFEDREVWDRQPGFVGRLLLKGYKKAKPNVVAFFGYDTEQRELSTHEMIEKLVKKSNSQRKGSHQQKFEAAEIHTTPTQAVNLALNDLPPGAQHTNLSKRLQRELITQDRKDPKSSIASARIVAVDPRTMHESSEMTMLDDDDNRSVHSTRTTQSRFTVNSKRSGKSYASSLKPSKSSLPARIRPPPLDISRTQEDSPISPARSARSLKSANLAQLRAEIATKDARANAKTLRSRQTPSQVMDFMQRNDIAPLDPRSTISPDSNAMTVGTVGITPKWNQPSKSCLKRSATAPKLIAMAT